MESAPALEKYYSAVVAEGIYPRRDNLRFYLDFLFRGIHFEGRRVLEIGGGSGYLTYYAASRGAAHVVCLEPESAGSSALVNAQFRALGERLDLGTVALRSETIQDFDPGGESFDLIVMHNSINHLDEAACVALREDAVARERYSRIFAKMAAMTRSSGRLVATDCTRHNAFGMLGLRNPMVPDIEWQKHQSPTFWAGLLANAGYHDPEIRWSTFNSMRWPGQVLFGNGVAAFFLTSHFCLRMSRK